MNDKKTIKIKESELVNLIDDILTEALDIKKKEWLVEQANNNSDKTKILEERLAALEAKLLK